MYNAAVNHMVEKLSFRKEEVMRELLKVESFATAEDEYGCAIKCLEHAEEEAAYWGDNNIEMFAAFMAVNQPLYGLILGLMSSLAAKETYIRPATDTSATVLALCQILELDEDFPHFHVVACERQVFLDSYVRQADAVYFVGEYRNAKKVQAMTKNNALFMFSGSGVNPMVITETADVVLAAQKAVDAGLYNSGQDCGRPKLHLVHKSVEAEFLEALRNKLGSVVCGDFGNPEAQVVPILRDSVFQNAVTTILANRDHIYRSEDGAPCGGYADLNRKMIAPTILKVDRNNKVLFYEFYAPVFTVTTYETEAELTAFFKADRYYLNAMYAFVFGQLPANVDVSRHTVVIHNQSLLDVEDSHQPFGGYGKHANFVYDGSSPEARPFLVSEELFKFGMKRKRKCKKRVA